MTLRDELLEPIPGASPGGVELRYDPVYDKIKEARREDDDAPQGDWQTARKTADWPLVIKLSREALAKKSKDLQLAAWLTEAMLRREGFAGLRQAVDLLDGLVERFWDQLYPAIDDGDLEMRAAPLDWVGSRLEFAVRSSAVTRAGHSALQYDESRGVPTEAEAGADSQKSSTREAAVADGKLTPEEFEQGFAATPKVWYKALAADIEGCLEGLRSLDDHSQEKFADTAPSYRKLRDAIEWVQRIAQHLLKRKLALEPDPPEEGAADAGVRPSDDVSLAGTVGDAAASPGAAPAAGRSTIAAQAGSRDDAAARIVSAARYLRQTDPYNPASYLLLRGFRWGELRASGRDVDPRLLEAPPTHVRTQLKTFLLDGKWRELLEAGETLMGTPQGRGWLDLQRYIVTACESLESEYAFVATAIRAELRTLLTAVPDLVDMTLMDDTAVANAETRAWIRDSVLSEALADAALSLSANGDGSSGEDGDGLPRPRDARALAAAEVRAGRTERAITLLTREASREKSRRGRYLFQTQLAGIMVQSGHADVAYPILEELIEQIDSYKLEEWEAGALVAEPLALMYKVLEKLGGDDSTKQSLYIKICRLDPLQAIEFSQATTPPQ